MDYTKTEFWIALAIGGSICAAGNTLLQFTNKSEEQRREFNVRSVLRDFCIGAFLAATIYMFIPDSISNMISGANSAVESVSKGFSGGGERTSVSSSGDIELRLGPARW